jgi:hypothetical protein
MTPDEINRLQRLVPSDSDAAYELWKAKQSVRCCPECDDIDRRELVSTFDRDWATAPRSLTRYVERDVVAYFWFKGRTAGRTEGLMESNADLREMMRAAKGRML